MGSTEWAEQHEAELRSAAAYFNIDVAVSGSKFGASAVPSLKQFVRDVTKAVPSPKGGTVYEAGRRLRRTLLQPSLLRGHRRTRRSPAAQVKTDVPVGDLGSGSDYTAFLQHVGVPRPTSVPAALRRLPFGRSTISPGSRSSLTLISCTSSRWHGSSASRYTDGRRRGDPLRLRGICKEIESYLDAARRDPKTNSARGSLDFAEVDSGRPTFRDGRGKDAVQAKESSP